MDTSVLESSQHEAACHTNHHLARLQEFLNTGDFLGPKGEYINIYDQRRKEGRYIIPFDIGNHVNPVEENLEKDYMRSLHGFDKKFRWPIEEFFDLVEKARIHGAPMAFTEKQYFSTKAKSLVLLPLGEDILDRPAETDENHEIENLPDDYKVTESCIELDFDILQKEDTRKIGEQTFFFLMHYLAGELAKDLDFSSMPNGEGVAKNEGHNYDVTFHIAFLQKDNVVLKQDKEYGRCYKESFHMRIFLKVSRAYKRYLIQKINNNKGFLNGLFRGMTVLNMSSALDANCANYGVMLLGSAKKSSTAPHKFTRLYRVVLSNWPNAFPHIVEDESFKPKSGGEVKVTKSIIDKRRNKEVRTPETFDYNLTYEMSVNYEDRTGLIKKRVVHPRVDLLPEIKSFEGKPKKIDMSEIQNMKECKNKVLDLVSTDDQAQEIYLLLDILKPDRAKEFDTWKQIVVLLAKINRDYKILAIYFSMKSYEKWKAGGYESLTEIWDWALNTSEVENTGMLIGKLKALAKDDNPVQYDRIQQRSSMAILIKKSNQKVGNLNDTDIAEIIRARCGHRFAVDEGPERGRQWYEFVSPRADMPAGYDYKWRRENYPDELDRVICHDLPLLAEEVKKYINTVLEPKTESEEDKKFYQAQVKNLTSYFNKLGNHGRITAVMKRCEVIMRKRGFIESLDKDADYIGVGNGVLRLNPDIELINYFHNIAVSRTTKVPYLKVKIDRHDPKYSSEHSNPYIRRLWVEIRRLFAGEGAEESFVRIMCHLATSLDWHKKAPTFFIWLGEGSNGKSFLLELHVKTIGEVVSNGYAGKMNASYFTTSAKGGGGPDEEKMMMQYARFIYISETEAGDVLQMAKIKEYTSETISGNRKFGHQEMFEAKAVFVFCSNNDPKITGRDYGTWRRILVYQFRMKFVPDPDPTDPFQYKIDPSLVKDVPYDPRYREAYLAILCYFYEVYTKEYFRDLDRIPKAQITKDTNNFRDAQDTLERFITKQLVWVGEDNATPILIDAIAERYVEWYKKNIGDTKLVLEAVKRELKSTRLKKQIFEEYGEQYVQGYRLLRLGEIYKEKRDEPGKKEPEKNEEKGKEKVTE